MGGMRVTNRLKLMVVNDYADEPYDRQIKNDGNYEPSNCRCEDPDRTVVKPFSKHMVETKGRKTTDYWNRIFKETLRFGA